MKFLVFAAILSLSPFTARAEISSTDLARIGKKVWHNECNGTLEGLTSWNAGEDFASLGIGHFIWYPVGRRGPFEESFPELVRFISARGEKSPTWFSSACPWKSRTDFQRDFH